MNVIEADGGEPALVAYGTTDNDGWWRKADLTWDHEGDLGDCGFCVSDARNRSRTVFSRGLGPSSTVVTDLGSNVYGPLAVDPDGLQASAIQALSTETVRSDSLDLAMLTSLPVHDSGGNALPLDLFTPGDTSNSFLLLRNQTFDERSDGPSTKFAGWSSVGPRLPGTPQRLWTSGGHGSPTYFLLTSDSAGSLSLFKRVLPPPANGPVTPAWTPILTGLIAAGDAAYGPAFINPYDPRMIFAVAIDKDHPNGTVMVSRDGGASFKPDEVLAALVTNSGRYSLGRFSASSQAAEVGSTFHGGTMFNPAHIAFSPDNPSYVAVCSPVTGLFFANLASGCIGRPTATRASNWKTLTPFLPQPFAYLSAIGFDGGQLYVATQGRGLLHVDDPFIAPPAAYIEPLLSGTGDLGVLRDNIAVPVPWAAISVLMTQIARPGGKGPVPVERRTVALSRQVRTDESGAISVGASLGVGQYIVRLTFHGDGQLAPYETQFLYTIMGSSGPIS